MPQVCTSQLTTTEATVKKYLERTVSIVTNKMNYFMSTGTIKSNNSLDLMQTTGFTIIAEKLNYLRYLSHFQSVHR